MTWLYAALVIFAINPNGGVAVTTLDYSDAAACKAAANMINANPNASGPTAEGQPGQGLIQAVCIPKFYAK